MSPSGAMQDKADWKAGCIILRRYDEGAAVEMAPGEPAADLELLAYGYGSFRSGDLQPHYAAGGAALKGSETQEITEVHSRFIPDNLLQFHACIRHLPPEKIRRVLIEGGENPAQGITVSSIAVCLRISHNPLPGFVFRADRIVRDGRVRNGCKIRDGNIFPCICEIICQTAAGFMIAGIADLIVVDEKQAACSLNSLPGVFRNHLGDALIPLAMIVRTDIEKRVVNPMVIPDKLFRLQGWAGRCIFGMSCLSCTFRAWT